MKEVAKKAYGSGSMRPWCHLDACDDTEFGERHWTGRDTGCDIASTSKSAPWGITGWEDVTLGSRAKSCCAHLLGRSTLLCVDPSSTHWTLNQWPIAEDYLLFAFLTTHSPSSFEGRWKLFAVSICEVLELLELLNPCYFVDITGYSDC